MLSPPQAQASWYPYSPPDPSPHSFSSAAAASRPRQRVIEDSATGGFTVSEEKPVHYDVNKTYLVLSVDDDPINQMVITEMLKGASYVTVTAMNGQEAVDYVKGEPLLPDIILLDVMMPVMNGFEACAEIRRMYPKSPIPILMVSARTGENSIVQGLKAGANDYISKPVNREELLARISTQLKLKDVYRMETDHRATDELLRRLLPDSIIRRLKEGQTVIADNHEKVTVLFSDIVGFTEISAQITARELVMLLNDMFSKFDQLVEKHNVHRVDIIGCAQPPAAPRTAPSNISAHSASLWRAASCC